MVFGIDDSEIAICGRPHTILAAIGVRDEPAIASALSEVKAQFGLSDADEVKWNGMKSIPQPTREHLSQELMVLLHHSIPLINITEGRNKQEAAKNLARQIIDYMGAADLQLQPEEGIELRFDESIISSIPEFTGFLHTLGSPFGSATVTSVRSHENAIIQLADVLAGFNRLATEIVLGRDNKQIAVPDDVVGDVNIDLLSYICIALRWAIWGEVPPPPDPENPAFSASWPFKRVGGFGVRIHSSIRREVIRKIYDSRIVYMGCMHEHGSELI